MNRVEDHHPEDLGLDLNTSVGLLLDMVLHRWDLEDLLHQVLVSNISL